jgi:VWFA-related protein
VGRWMMRQSRRNDSLPGLSTRSKNLVMVAVAAVALWDAAAAAAQEVFRTSVNLVLVDLRVLRGDEQATDLRAEELTLLVDGIPRPIVSLSYHRSDEAVAPRQQGRTVATGGDATRTAATQVSGPRRIVLVVDSTSIQPGEGPRLSKAAEDFVRRLPASYALAVATLPLAGGIRFDPDRRASTRTLTEALKRASGSGSGMEGIAGFGCSGASASEGCSDRPGGAPKEARDMNLTAEAQLRGRGLLRDLQWLFRAVGDGPSDVVLISGRYRGHESMRPEIDRTIKTARVTGVRLHALEVPAQLSALEMNAPVAEPFEDAGRSPRMSGNPLAAEGASAFDLPAETGGIEETRPASGTRFFKQLEHHLAGSYLLAFEPLPSERDGKPHRIEIRVSRRPRSTVHARKLFVLEPTRAVPSPRDAAVAPGPRGSDPSNTSESPAPDSRPAGLASAPSAALPAAPVSGHAPEAAQSSAGVTQAAPGLRTLIERASAYVEGFQRTLSELVAEERYVQVVKLWSGAAPTQGREPDLAWRPGTGAQLTTGSSGTLRRRQLLSDVLLVQAPGEVRIGYRDVAEVDGKSVRDRALRVQKLFMSGRADDRRQLRRIAAESARHNLGTGRNFNLPTFPLEPLRASALERFIWTQQPDDVRNAECCAVVGFFEVRSPTLVTTPADHDVPVSGQLWVEPRTGRVTRAVLQFAHQVEHVEGAFDVTYGRRDGLDVLIPERLWEWYRTPDLEHLGRPAYVEGEASYGKIRRFTVTSDVTVR